MISKKLIPLPFMLAAILSGCGHDDDKPARPNVTIPAPTVAPLVSGSQFTVEVRNNTANQPLSPLALISSSMEGEVFQLGQPASDELQRLAEEGDNTVLLTSKSSEARVDINQSGLAPIPSGSSDRIRLTVGNTNAKYLTTAAMLVNTNDGFIAEEIDLSTIAVGETIRITAPVWDAGTELNTEAAGTIPGPADPTADGTFNLTRNDIVNAVTTHQGVISNQDGLTSSVLTSQHRILNPAATISITRVR